MKEFSKHGAVCFLALAVCVAGCASDDTYRPNTQTRAAKAESHDYGQSLVMSFSPGSADLTEITKSKLRDIVSTIGMSNVERVEIASWSDKSFPRGGPDLPRVDRELASKRAEQVEDFLRQDTGISMFRLKSYNMAETSNWMARTLQTDGAELKSVLAKQAETPLGREDFNVISNEGGPSKVVVIFIRK